ncbi:hypothetical protein LIA77_04787 [Sarocladium implicatum]|nr:hypothetical protein LIA77_04787 [Sarocladium implicatum]
MKFAAALTSLLALGATAAPAAEANTGDVQDIEARHASCGKNSYWQDNCCKCKVQGQVYNKYWNGCNWPNPKADKKHECHGGSYYDYHRDCCACSNTELFYYKNEKTCQPCGPNAYYDHKENKCKCKHQKHHWHEGRHGCY